MVCSVDGRHWTWAKPLQNVWEHVVWAVGGCTEAPWFVETWVVHMHHAKWQLLSSYQVVSGFPDDQTCYVGLETWRASQDSIS